MPDDGFLYELVQGEVRRMSPAGFRHGAVAAQIVFLLQSFVKPRNLGVVGTAEAGFVLARGPDTVRGYPLRELAKDEGNATQLELYTPDLARRVGLSDRFRMRFLAFYDYGTVENNDTQPADKDSIASAGVGLRLGYGTVLSLRFDVAQILHESANLDNDSQRVSAALALIF